MMTIPRKPQMRQMKEGKGLSTAISAICQDGLILCADQQIGTAEPGAVTGGP